MALCIRHQGVESKEECQAQTALGCPTSDMPTHLSPVRLFRQVAIDAVSDAGRGRFDRIAGKVGVAV